MHELSFSRAIASLVLAESAKREAEKILSVEIEIGQLSFLNPEQVEFWLRLDFEKTPASEAELKIEVIEPEIWCSKCGYGGGLKIEDDPIYHYAIPFFGCPRCGSGEVTIKSGQECRVKRIEILA